MVGWPSAGRDGATLGNANYRGQKQRGQRGAARRQGCKEGCTLALLIFGSPSDRPVSAVAVAVGALAARPKARQKRG